MLKTKNKISMRKNLLFLISVIFFLQPVISQENIEDDEVLREVFADGEFFFASEDYPDALVEYMKLYRRGFSDNANLNYKIGICYLNIAGQKEKSIDYFLKATEKVSDRYRESALREKNAPLDTYLFLGNAYRVTNQLDKAIEAYSKYKELLEEKEEDALNIAYANQQINSVKNAKEQMQKPLNVDIINIDRPINNSTDNFRGAISGDHTSMVYMNSLPFYDALYYSTKDEDGEWSTPTNITPQVQSDGNQYATALSHDGTMLYLSWEDPFNSDIYYSEYEDGRWTRSRSLSSEINTKFWESHASVSKDGKTLYFASNRQETLGEMDIFFSRKIGNKWSEPENIGDVINTNLNEDTPFITPDGKRLYFSSQGHSTIGGYDVFYSDLKEDGTWSEPVNLRYPINTTDDDLFYVPINPYEGYMSRYVENGNGGEDILRFEFPGLADYLALQNPQEVAETLEEQVETIEETVEEETEEQVETILEEPEEDVVEEMTEEVEEEPVDEEVVEEIEEETTVEEVAKKAEVEIRPIFFEFDKSTLTREAKNELDKVAELLMHNKAVQVDLIGYADPLGNQQYNINLSKKRAKSALDYLSEKGIDAERMSSTGKGETNFIAVNKKPDGTDNPEGRRYNRRVEIELDNTNNENIIIIKPDVVPNELKTK